MEKLLIALVGVMILQGCEYQNTNQADIKRAIVVCNDIDNIINIRVHVVGRESVLCVGHDVRIGISPK